MQLHVELPYGRSLLLPVEGSEAFIKYMEKAIVVSQDWRKDNKFTVEPDKLMFSFVEPAFVNPVEATVEEAPTSPTIPATSNTEGF